MIIHEKYLKEIRPFYDSDGRIIVYKSNLKELLSLFFNMKVIISNNN